MHDGGKIILGLVVFLALATFPIWYNAVIGEEAKAPDIPKPTKGEFCVEDTDYMKREHMTLLMEWRDEVVREDDRTFVDAHGREFDKSLTGTCLDCHENAEDFCFECHDYAGVSPYCWDCHVYEFQGAGGQ
jgi:hypothetical protein